jgi:hypothetical protein
MKVRTTSLLGLVERKWPDAPKFVGTLPAGSTGTLIEAEDAVAAGLPDRDWQWLVPDVDPTLVVPAVDGWWEEVD